MIDDPYNIFIILCKIGNNAIINHRKQKVCNFPIVPLLSGLLEEITITYLHKNNSLAYNTVTTTDTQYCGTCRGTTAMAAGKRCRKPFLPGNKNSSLSRFQPEHRKLPGAPPRWRTYRQCLRRLCTLPFW